MKQNSSSCFTLRLFQAGERIGRDEVGVDWPSYALNLCEFAEIGIVRLPPRLMSQRGLL
jgi:hypothetical protein